MISDACFYAVLQLVDHLQPWPFESQHEELVLEWVDEEAQRRGFADWEQAHDAKQEEHTWERVLQGEEEDYGNTRLSQPDVEIERDQDLAPTPISTGGSGGGAAHQEVVVRARRSGRKRR